MNFEVTKAKVIPFEIAEEEVKNGFLDFLVDGEDAPIDVACKFSNMKIKKELYPVRCFKVNYTADWSATSIWEHKEAYTEYESKTIYIDYYGKEHSSPGFDHFHNGSHIGTSSFGGNGKRPWKAQQKTVPVTKYKMVVDNVEPTYGNIGNNYSFQSVITYDETTTEKLAEWIVSFPIESRYINCSEENIKDCEIKQLVNDNVYAWHIAEKKVKNLAGKLCRADVPGDRCEGLTIGNFKTEYKMDIVLIPLFHILYEYKEQQFECWFSGLNKENYYHEERPHDNSIREESARLDSEIKKVTKDMWKYGILSFLVMPLLLLPLFFSFSFSIFATILVISEGAGVGFFDVSLIIFPVLVVIEVKLVKKFIQLYKERKKLKLEKSDYLVSVRQKRVSIATIVKNETLSEQEKQNAINNILDA